MNNRLFGLTLVSLGPLICCADDAAIAFGGNPTILHRHPSIRMVSERVVISVKSDRTVYDCQFVLHNSGKSCAVQVGFPDRGEDAYATGFSEDTAAAKSKNEKLPVFAELHDFRSKVDGAPVRTVLLPDRDEPASWHAKLVKFGAGQTRVLDEAFWVSAGGGITADGGSVREARYVLDTGSSWAGKIGAVEVLLDLSQSGVQLPAKPIPLRRLAPDGSARSYDGWPKLPLGTVLWKGFTSPTVTPTGLRFFGKNLKPSIADDLALDFGYKPAR